jgi:hypothetical protein
MSNRGRPISLPWDEITPTLINLRQKGATYNDLVDYITDNHGTKVTSQTVRLHIKDQEKPIEEPQNNAATETPKSASAPDYETGMKKSIYEWLYRHPAASIPEIAAGTNLPIDAVTALHETVKKENRGYTIIPPRHRRETYSETEMLDALTDAFDGIGVPPGHALSQQMYAAWREKLPEEDKKLFPSPLAYRRRYGSWGEAAEAAGLPRNERVREYGGTTKEDAIVWLAHFLRDMRENSDYMIEATAAEYRQWLRKNPEAPSEELLRIKGIWGYQLVEAAELERTTKKLPAPRPMWTGGRVKKARGLFSDATKG